MGNGNELETITTAYYLENRLDEMRHEKDKLDAEEPQRPKKPGKPTLKEIDTPLEQYPPTNTNHGLFSTRSLVFALACFLGGLLLFGATVSMPRSNILGDFCNLVITLLFLAIPVCFVVGFFDAGKQAEEGKEKILSSPAYIETCRQIDKRNAIRQENARKKAQEALEAEMKDYQERILPLFSEYDRRWQTEIYPKWQHDEDVLTTAIEETDDALQEVYETNMIPGKYRNYQAVTFLAAFMGTSQYDLKFAIERYDKEIDQILANAMIERMDASLMLQQQTLSEIQYSNYLNEQSIEIAQRGNELLTSIRNWQAADTALHAYDIYSRKKKEKEMARSDKN